MSNEPGSPPRLHSVDLLRGLAMILMALDHTRDFFHQSWMMSGFDPTDLTRTTGPLFITRWVTHFCAPVFVFLAGTGAFLSATRGKSTSELSRFLFVRGLWLILLELTVVRFGWVFNLDFSFIGVQVIWALGWCMIALAGLVYLPAWIITAIGVTMIAAHNLLDGIQAQDLGAFGWLWNVLHEMGMFQLPSGTMFYIAYPLIPWIGVMAAGYGFGALLLLERDKRRRWLLGLGVALTLIFIILRATNAYGDPKPWSAQKNLLFTIFSFVNTEKYPPSLLFLLMTLGPSIASLAFFDREPGRLARPIIVFGRVPLFYYVLHLPLIHLTAVLFAYARYGHAEWLFNPVLPAPPGYGYSLPVVYLVWLAAVVLLYPLCRWFAEIKRRRRHPWLSYL